MKKHRGEALLVTMLLAMAGCVATAWLQHFGVPLPVPSTHQEAHK